MPPSSVLSREALVAGVRAAVHAAARHRGDEPDAPGPPPGGNRLSGRFRDRWLATVAWHCQYSRWDTADSLAWLIAEAHPEETACWLVLALLQARAGEPGYPARVAQLWQRAARPLELVADAGALPPADPAADPDPAKREWRALALGLSAWLASVADPEAAKPAEAAAPSLAPEDLEALDPCERLAATRYPAWNAPLRLSPSQPETDAFLGVLATAAGAWPAATVFFRNGAHSGNDEDRRQAFIRLSDHLEAWRAALERGDDAVDDPLRGYLGTSTREINAERFVENVCAPEPRARLLAALRAKLHDEVAAMAGWMILLQRRPAGMDRRPCRVPEDDEGANRWGAWLSDALAWAFPADPSFSPAEARIYEQWRTRLLRAGGAPAWSELFIDVE